MTFVLFLDNMAYIEKRPCVYANAIVSWQSPQFNECFALRMEWSGRYLCSLLYIYLFSVYTLSKGQLDGRMNSN